MTSPANSNADGAVVRRPPHRLTIGVLCVGVIASRWLMRARAPDGPDSFGFVLGMARRFDMEQLQPHFPGYPVYVALGKVLCWMGLSGLNAATAISSVAAGVSAWGLAVCAERLAGPRAGVPVVVLYFVAWLPWLLGSAALSDSLGSALAISALAVIAMERPRLGVSGLLAGALLGTRASYWPIVLSLLVLWWLVGASPRARTRAFAWFAVGVMLWAIPFVAMVGTRDLWALGATHMRGHFGWWGGSVATKPDLALRLVSFLSDFLFDGFAPARWALAAIGLILAAILVRGRVRGNRPRIAVAPLLLVMLPYALWVFLAQNVIEQPRHVLPLVEGGLLLIAAVVASHRTALAAIALIAASVTAPLIWQRAHTPPAAEQAAEWLGQNEQPAATAIMADRSWRFFAELPGEFTVRKHALLSEVIGDLSRFSRFPSAIWLTSEIDLHSGLGEETPLPRNWQVEPGPMFCRDARIDRAQPCLGLVKLSWNPK